MIYVLISSVVFFTLGVATGLHIHRMQDRINKLENYIKAKRLKADQAPPTSTILEPPLTPAEKIAREQEELIERLNPQ